MEVDVLWLLIKINPLGWYARAHENVLHLGAFRVPDGAVAEGADSALYRGRERGNPSLMLGRRIGCGGR